MQAEDVSDGSGIGIYMCIAWMRGGQDRLDDERGGLVGLIAISDWKVVGIEEDYFLAIVGLNMSVRRGLIVRTIACWEFELGG